MTYIPGAFSRDDTQRGNVFFALFAAVALLGVLGITVSTFIKGPLSSSVKVTRMNVAESQMAVMAQAIVMQSSAGMNCDSDAFVEPVAWRVPGGVAAPAGGGLLPTSVNVASTIDPWGSEFGYCVWDHGADDCGSTERLAGASNNAEGQTVIALISAGPDKTFTTTCRSFAAADVNANGTLGDPGDLAMVSKAAETDDDIIFTYSYREAAGASGGLWTLKSSDENVATISKDLEVDGNAQFEGAGVFSALSADSMTARNADFIDFMDGLRLPDSSVYDPDCDGTTAGVLRRNAATIEMCVNNVWTDIGGSSSGGGNNQLGTDSATVCDGDAAGAIRYNDALSLPQYCDGVAWRNFVTQSSAVLLAVTPGVIQLPVIGPCTSECPHASGPATQDITVTNMGSVVSGNITQTSFNVTLNPGSTTCGGPLAPGASCIFNVSGRTSGNFTADDGYFDIYNGGVLVTRLTVHSTGSGFGCSAGVYGWGGQVVNCVNGTTPNFIVNTAGCDGSSFEPRCTRVAADDPVIEIGYDYHVDPTNANTVSGAQNSVNLAGYGMNTYHNYCEQLVAQGYDDWFLPSSSQLQTLLYPLRATLLMTGSFWSSTYQGNLYWDGAHFNTYNFASNSLGSSAGGGSHKVRCMRQHNTALPAIQSDISAKLFHGSLGYDAVSSGSIGIFYAPVAGVSVSSQIFNIRSTNVPVTASIAGAGTPTISVNGRAAVASTTAYPGDTIKIFTTSPAVGAQEVYTLSVGSSTFTWTVRTPGANTRRAFVTSTTYTGSMGGIGGADGHCQTRATAAGLGGTWYALLGTQANPMTSRLPWNWNRLENMAGDVIATDYKSLFTRGLAFSSVNIGAPIAYNEFGNWAGARRVHTGAEHNQDSFFQGGDCNQWTSADPNYWLLYGWAGSRSTAWSVAEYTQCNVPSSLYCIGPF
jgi:hypothetical protein